MAEAETSDEVLDVVASGAGVALLASDDAAIFDRDDLAFRLVEDLAPCELALVWRVADRRPVVRAAVEALAVARGCGSLN